MKKCFYFPTWEEKEDVMIGLDDEYIFITDGENLIQKYNSIFGNNKRISAITGYFEYNSTSTLIKALGMDFKNLKGKKIINININEDKTEITLETEKELFRLYHTQCCCESVWLEDITEDYKEILINEEILYAEEVISSKIEQDDRFTNDDSETWTFYKLATKKGYVDMRWVGGSNGYYSESVDCEVTKKNDPILVKLCKLTGAQIYGDYIVLENTDFTKTEYIFKYSFKFFTTTEYIFKSYSYFLQNENNDWERVKKIINI